MSATEELQEGVARALARAGVGDVGTIAVGCSYGPDSLALADALLQIRPGRVALVYVHHGLRPEANDEAERVRSYAEEHWAPAMVMPVKVRPAGEGLEAAARVARYAALDAAADELGARWIALGHTAGDQTETVVHRLIRGAGTAGLAGIPPVRGRIIRPLLQLGRELIERYLEVRGLVAARDVMNEDRRFMRARLRHDIVPTLRRENPALDAAVGRAAAALREADEAVGWMADRAAAETGVARAPGITRLSATALGTFPAAVQKKLVARLAGELGTSLDAAHLDAVVALAAAPPRGTALLDVRGLRARREYAELVLAAPSARAAPTAVDILEDGPSQGPYRIRTWQPGDRMRPASLRGRSRKLQDLFTDRKVPRAARAAARVVVRERDGEIMWAEFIGLSFHAPRLRVTLTRTDPPVIYD